MQDLWDRIDVALGKVADRINADRDEDDRVDFGLDRLGGVTEERLDGLATLIGFPLPEDFRASYLIRDGLPLQVAPSGPSLNGCQVLLDLDRIIHEVNFWAEFLRESPRWAAEPRPANRWGYPDGPVASIMWSPGWLPFVGEGTGNHLCLDLDPPDGGTFGQVFEYGRSEGPTRVHFPSFHDYLERFALNLESGYIRVDEGFYGEYIEEVAKFRRKTRGLFDPPAGA